MQDRANFLELVGSRVGSDLLRGTGFLFGVMRMFRNYREVIAAQHYEYILANKKINART